MYLEAEVYTLLNGGFALTMGFQLSFLILLRCKHKLNKDSFLWLLGYLTLFALAGYKLLEAINTFAHNNPMGSENASLSIGMAGVLWIISVLCLLKGIACLLGNTASSKG